MGKQWADVPGWPGYTASTDGEIMGCRIKRPLKFATDKHGYLHVYLGNRGAGKNVFVHRVVLSAFRGPIPEGKQVNHKNGIKTDNRLENLEAVTASENVLHAYANLNHQGGHHKNHSRGLKHPNSKLTEDKVREIRQLYADGLTQVHIAAKYEILQCHVSALIRRTSWAHVV